MSKKLRKQVRQSMFWFWIDYGPKINWKLFLEISQGGPQVFHFLVSWVEGLLQNV